MHTAQKKADSTMVLISNRLSLERSSCATSHDFEGFKLRLTTPFPKGRGDLESSQSYTF